MKLNLILLGAAASLFVAAGAAEAQRTKSSDSEPCCNILAIEASKGLVTAKTKAGKTFQFKVPDAAMLKSLRAGQAIATADFTTARVSIKWGEPCCNIIAAPAVKPNVNPGEPCCSITAIDARTGIATAKETSTGRLFRFEVKDKTLLTSLKVGQTIFADFGSSKVRIHGAEPCCSIIGHGVN